MSLTNDEYEYEYELLDWISVELLNWEWLSANPNAIDLLKKIEIKLIGIDYPEILLHLI